MNELTAGPGASVHSTPFGRIVRARRTGSAFNSPWFATILGDEEVGFRQGTVNGLRATIGGIPLEGDEKREPPTLKLPSIHWNKDGLGWLCVEVTFRDPKTRDATPWAVLKAEMVQVADPDAEDPAKPGSPFKVGGARPLLRFRARWPIAMLQQDGDSFDLFQITHFNLTHRVALKADGVSAARHFFY